MKNIHKAVIPAAGFGTRFLPATKAIAKEMIPIIDKPTIEYIVREAMDAGIDEFLIVINEHKDSIKEHFGHNYVLEEFLKEKNKQSDLDIILEKELQLLFEVLQLLPAFGFKVFIFNR